MSRFLCILVLFLYTGLAVAQPSFSKSKRIMADIYSQQQVTFYCDCDYRRQGKQLFPDLRGCGYDARKNEKRARRIEWEHVMPAWAFGHQLQCWQEGGRKNCRKDPDFKRMEADMHNLVPAVGEVNGDRSNYSFGMLEGEVRRYGQCDMEIDFKARTVEPAPHRRGDIARTYYYMRDTYGVRISRKQQKLFEAWAKSDPVDDWERRRNQLIWQQQGNSNPYVQ
ncbi:MAG: endonuclease [Pontibacterium sp.]